MKGKQRNKYRKKYDKFKKIKIKRRERKRENTELQKQRFLTTTKNVTKKKSSKA